MFDKVLIVNRGAIARRVVQACNALGVASAVVYSDADAAAPYLEEAGEAHRLPGERAQDTYLNQAALLNVLKVSGADALHPGYGFLAENASFAEAVQAQGARFIGPDAKWLRSMGDKAEARSMAQTHGFPVFTGSPRLSVSDGEDAWKAAAEQVGYPLMIKPVAGGGGIGMRVVTEPRALNAAVAQAAALSEQAFGDGGLFFERWIESGRHIEFQLLGDGRGGALHLYERECSLQRRHQKVLEESPAPGIDRAEISAMAAKAVQMARAIGYDNVGTLETLRAGPGDYGFLEMNTRIQVEHGVTEMITGLDLVSTQIRLAAGERLPEVPPADGHALEVRIYAEDPFTQLPSTGRLTVFEVPRLHGVRVDTGYCAGQWVTPFYDPLLAKVIGHGRTREQAIGRVAVALKAFAIQGVRTNVPLLNAVLTDDEFLAGRVDTGYLGRLATRISNRE